MSERLPVARAANLIYIHICYAVVQPPTNFSLPKSFFFLLAMGTAKARPYSTFLQIIVNKIL